MAGKCSLRQVGREVENYMTNNPWYTLVGRNFKCGMLDKCTTENTKANRNIGWGLAGMVAGLSLVILGVALRKPCGRLGAGLITLAGAGVSLAPLFFNVLPGLYVKATSKNNLL